MIVLLRVLALQFGRHRRMVEEEKGRMKTIQSQNRSSGRWKESGVEESRAPIGLGMVPWRFCSGHVEQKNHNKNQEHAPFDFRPIIDIPSCFKLVNQ